MADQRNVIEIILQARDDTAAAFASLSAKMGLAELQAKKTAQQTENLSQTFDNLAQGTSRVERSFDELQKSYGSNQIALGKNVALTKELAQAHVAVEQATRQATAARDRDTSSVAQEALAQAKLAEALNDLETKIKGQIAANNALSAGQKKRATEQAEQHVQAMREAAEETAVLEQQEKQVKSLAATEAKADADRERSASKRAAIARQDVANYNAVQRSEKAKSDQEVADVRRASQELKNYEKSINDAAKARHALINQKGLTDVKKLTLDVDFKTALAKAGIAKREIEKVVGHVDATIDLDDSRFREHLPGFLALKELVGKDEHFNVDVDVGAATAKLEAFNEVKREAGDGSSFAALGGAFGTLASKIAEGGGSVAAFDNVLRGAAAFAIAGFLQPIIMLAGAAAGALLALGSAAIYAGGALAGGLVAGLAQAIPVLGVVALAVTRLAAVFKAVQATQTAQQQSATQGATIHQSAAKSANTYANALDGIRSAEEQLASAHRNVGVAETALSKARQQATRDIQDMVLAEKEAQLQAEASTLSQQNAAKALTVAVATGGDVQQAQLDVQSANLAAQRSAVELPRAQVDAATAQRQGVSGAPGVQSAARQLADAQRGVKDAEAAVDRAKRSAAQAGDAATLAGAKIAGAAANADYLVGKLSPVEKKLYDIVEQARKVFDTFAKDVSAPIINATGTVVEKIVGIFQDSRIKNAMTSLSGTMAKDGLKLFSAFTNPRAIDTFLGFIKDAQKNLGPLTGILTNVGKIFLDIAKSAGPTLTNILKFFDQATKGFEKFLDTPRGKKSLASFFTEGTTALFAFLKLGGAIVKLFLAIAGPGGGAKTGIDLLVGATGGINKLTNSINSGGKAAKFFHDMFKITKDIIKDLAPLFTSIGGQLGETFTKKGEGSVKGFVNILAKVVIPALGDFIRKVGGATSTIGKFLEKNPEITKLAAALAGMAVSGALLWKALTLGLGPILKIAEGLGKLLLGADGLTVVLGVVGETLAALAWPIAITVGIGILLAKLGLLKPLIDVFVDGFKDIVKIAGPPFKDLVTQVERLWNAFGKGKGAFAIIKPILSFLISQVLSRGVKDLATFIGGTFAGVFKILAGAIGLVVDILTGKWGKAWDDVKKILSGMADIALAGIRGFLAAFGDLPKKVLKFFEKIIDDIIKFFGIASPSKKFFNIGIDLVKGLINGVESLGKDLLDLGGKILHWIWNGLIAWGRTEFNIEKWLWTHLLNGITSLADKLGDLGGKIIKWIWNGLLAWARTEFTIGQWILDHITNGIGNLLGKIGDIGGNIIDAIVDGIKKSPKKIVNAIESLLPGPLKTIASKIFSVFQEGGPVGSGYGGGDRVPAVLEAGEHVWTKEEVKAAGGHGALYAMRAVFGRGGQGGGGRYADGGAVGASNQGQISATTSINTDPAMKQAVKFSTDFQKLWKSMWTAIEHLTTNGSESLSELFTKLVNSLEKLIAQLGNRVISQFDSIKSKTIQDSQQLASQVGQSFQNLQNAVFKGMTYIGTATNTALKSFGGKAVQLDVSPPGGGGNNGNGKAEGGWIGNPGERGRDAVATWLGRGEAVLNWGQQKLVEPALRRTYGFGLNDLFHRSRGLHAGTDSSGFASGGSNGGSSHWARLIAAANKVSAANFPYVYAGGHEQPSHFEPFDCSGAVSYVVQQAGYKVPTVASGQIPSWGFPAGGDGATVFYNAGHTFMKIGNRYFGTSGFARPGGGAGWFDQTPGASYLSTFSQVHLPDLGADAPFALADGSTGIGKIVVKGAGVLQALAQLAINKVRGVANNYIGKQDSLLTAGSGQFGDFIDFGGGGPVAAQIYRILKAAGFNKIGASGVIGNAYGESGLNPASIGSGGGGLWGFTTSPVSLADLQAFAASVNKPWTNVAVQTQFLLDHLETSLRSTVNADSTPAQAADDFMNIFERPGIPRSEVREAGANTAYRQGYAKGGEIPGGPGQPIPILAHAREWVVNPGQQSKIASWLGISRDRLKGALGFTGGPSSFAGGGDPKKQPLPTSFSDPITAKDLLEGNFADLVGLIMPGGIAGWNQLVARVNKAIRKFGDKVGDFFQGVNTLVAQDGIFDQLTAAIDARLTQMQTGLALAQSGLRRVTRGGVSRLQRARPLTDTQADQRDLAVTNANLVSLNKERGEMSAELQKTNARIADARKAAQSGTKEAKDLEDEAKKIKKQLDDAKKGTKEYKDLTAELKKTNDQISNAKEGTKAYKNLLGARFKLITDLDSTDQKIAQARADQFAKQQTLFNQQTTTALRRPTIAAARADVRSRTGAALDNDKTILNAGRDQVDALKDQQKVLQKRAKEAAAKARKDPRWQQTADDLAQQVRDGAASIVEAQATNVQNAQTAFQDQLTKQLRRSTRRQQWADIANRIGSALGNTDIVAAASDVQISALKGQQKILQEKYNEAAAKAKKDPRWQSIADDLASQLGDTTASIVEAQAQALQDQVDTLNNNVARQQASVDISNRMADVQESMGDPVGAAQARLRNMQATGGILAGQVGGLQGLLGTAQAQGNVGLVQTLTDQIADLNTQIAENTAAMSDQTVAVRQATLDQINNRAQFQTGVFGGLGTLVAAVATNLNIDTSQQQETLLQQTFQALQDQFSQLASALFSGFGVNLMGLSGTDFASAVSQLNFSALESGMTSAQQGQFEALIQALIDTQNALASNTTQLDTLTGTLGQAQSFSSTAWQVLRMAVFTGAGGLLPQFQIPSMQSGGYVSKSGIFNLHAGEFVVNPSHPGGQQIGNGDVNVTVHEAGPETDYTYLANRIAFATRTPST